MTAIGHATRMASLTEYANTVEPTKGAQSPDKTLLLHRSRT